MVSLKEGPTETAKRVPMAEKITTIHYDSDAAGDAGLSKSFGKYRLAK